MHRSPIASTLDRCEVELRLLLCTARTALDADRESRLETLLRGGIDWGRVTHLGSRHRILGFVERHLRQQPDELVPAKYKAALRRHVLANQIRVEFLTRNLLQALEALTAAGLRALPIKGPAVACGVFGDVGLREFYDLDIFLPRDEMQPAIAALRERGYRPTVDRDAAETARYLRASHELQLVHQEHGTLIELHWLLAPPHARLTLSHEELWKNRVPLDILDTTVNHLGAADLLLLLTVNGTKEQWNRIERVSQIAELIRREPDMPWDLVGETARRSGLRRSLDLALYLASELLGEPVPDAFQQSIARDHTVTKLAEEVVARYRHPTGDMGSFRYSAFVLAVRERFRDRFRYLLHRTGRLTATATDSTQDAAFRWRSLPRRALRLPQLAWRYGIRGPVVAFFGRAPR